jgi:hypothetical protein
MYLAGQQCRLTVSKKQPGYEVTAALRKPYWQEKLKSLYSVHETVDDAEI